ncbi:hypothetical protein [Cyclobacterium qasimii]|uniref:RiboL-PSP-HEPN domain-containing protein n=2 Tax=Cyclobacterium qasimii TaxID=1350429 RepID=S7VGB2_9BACT|nr:hypothetical protein [Cyclobacterium qasimii]EPR69220.1 hypothetical protein ADICYQ_1720 [Cyclobacterium qasimii M12-11B]GEO20987.1 hypothetical protein CQA01_15210 [Cyclobacterium qasimii]
MRIRNPKPTLLLFEDLVEPIRNSIEELNVLSSQLDFIPEQEFLKKGTFVYVISLFESSISECLKRYLMAFPKELNDGQISGKESKFMADSIFASELIELLVDDFISKISYESLTEILSKTLKFLKIEADKIEYNNKDLIERKERRNLVVHNNLKIDKKYIRITKSEANKLGTQLDIKNEYLVETIYILKNILSQLLSELTENYNCFDKTKLLKGVWYYVFDSPLLNYDMYWNENHVFVYEQNEKQMIDSLSSGEKTMLAYWMQHYNDSLADRYFKFSDFPFINYSQPRMNFLVEFFNKYPLILQY